MLVRCLVSALVLAGCASATPPLTAPAPKVPVAANLPEASTPAVSRRHRIARRLSPPFLASSSLRHVAATDTATALVSTDYDGPR